MLPQNTIQEQMMVNMNKENKRIFYQPDTKDEYLDEIAEALLNGSEQQQPQYNSSKGIDKGDYIFMPSHNLLVAKKRSHLNKNWYEAHKALHNEGARMLTLIEFVDFLNLLRNGDDEFKRIYNEIGEVRRESWKIEWLDVDFKVIKGILHINYDHRFVNGILTPKNSEPLEVCLIQDKTPGISIGDWLSNPIRQGLPRANIQDGSLYYLYPRSDNNSVARFDAGSGRAYLDCYWNQQDSYASLGVRASRENM